MKSGTDYLTFNIPARIGFLNITAKLDEIVHASGVSEGILLCNTSPDWDAPGSVESQG